jgi:hypothetical protein
MNEIMRLDADEENEKIIKNLVEFMHVLKGKMDMLQKAATPPTSPAPPPAAPPVMLGQPANPPSPQAPNALGPVAQAVPQTPPQQMAPEPVLPSPQVQQAPPITVNTPPSQISIPLTVIIERNGKVRITRDELGNVTGSEPVDEEPMAPEDVATVPATPEEVPVAP